MNCLSLVILSYAKSKPGLRKTFMSQLAHFAMPYGCYCSIHGPEQQTCLLRTYGTLQFY